MCALRWFESCSVPGPPTPVRLCWSCCHFDRAFPVVWRDARVFRGPAEGKTSAMSIRVWVRRRQLHPYRRTWICNWRFLALANGSEKSGFIMASGAVIAAASRRPLNCTRWLHGRCVTARLSIKRARYLHDTFRQLESSTFR